MTTQQAQSWQFRDISIVTIIITIIITTIIAIITIIIITIIIITTIIITVITTNDWQKPRRPPYHGYRPPPAPGVGGACGGCGALQSGLGFRV